MDHAAAAQKAAEDHLAACWDYLDAEMGIDEGEDVEMPPEPDALGPFCGCTTCVIRETLHAAYPHLRLMALEEERA